MGDNMVYRPSYYIYVKIDQTTIRLRHQEMEATAIYSPEIIIVPIVAIVIIVGIVIRGLMVNLVGKTFVSC